MVPDHHHRACIDCRPPWFKRCAAGHQTRAAYRYLLFFFCHQRYLPVCKKSTGPSPHRWHVPCGGADPCFGNSLHLAISDHLFIKKGQHPADLYIFNALIDYSTLVIFTTLVGRCRCTGVLPVFTTTSPAFKNPRSFRMPIWSRMISSRLSSSP